MIRDGSLRRRRRRRRAEADPMAGVANLADVMLVLACGLMIAIIMFWKVDLSNVIDIIHESELREVEDPDQVFQDDSDAARFEEKGKVIQDPETGQMYVLEN